MNKFLSQAIEARSVDREKTVHVNRFSLRFRESDKEREYHQDLDLGFSTAMCCSLLLLILSAALQVKNLSIFSIILNFEFNLKKIKFTGVSFATYLNIVAVILDCFCMDKFNINVASSR